MFEIIYISPSCNQGIGFINALAVRLKWCGIMDFTIDKEHIQLKSDKFIVSAVDIFGCRLGVSHHMTKYYIDMVSNTVFPRHCGKSHAFERLKELKRSFKEGIKEISEEELIEILTEESAHD